MRAFAILGLGLACVACARRPVAPVDRAVVDRATERAPIEREAAPAATIAWPPALLVAEHDGPTFHRRATADRGFAWIRPGTAVRLRGDVRRGRVRAYVEGPLRVRGWMEVRRLEGSVLARGRVQGTPLFVVPGDRVRLTQVDGGTATVEGEARLGHPAMPRSPRYLGAFPLAHLGAAMEGGGEGPSAGREVQIRGGGPLTDRPGGEVRFQVPALDPPLPATVLRERGDWLGVRIGVGPYLVGYLPRAALDGDGPRGKQDHAEVLDPWSDRPPRIEGLVRNPWDRPSGEDAEEADAIPARVREAVVRPLHRVHAGARLEVDGAVVAIFGEAGWAVELERDGARVEVLAAVDDDVTVRGLVDADALVSAGPLPTE